MAEKTLHIVQQFEKQGRKLVKGRALDFKTSAEALTRAERDAARFAGVIAVTVTVDTETGETLEEPVLLVSHGEVPEGIMAA